MADLTPLNFDPEQHEDMGDGFEVLPPGTYAVCIVDAEVAKTKAGTGTILVLKYQVIEGPHTGSTFTDRLNIKNPSDMAQKIGLSQLKNICDAVGHKGVLSNTEAIHGKPFSVKITIEEFRSNTSGKMLKSNKVEKRMPRTESVTYDMPPASSGGAADNTQAGTGAASGSAW